jgi:hypothetical protein
MPYSARTIDLTALISAIVIISPDNMEAQRGIGDEAMDTEYEQSYSYAGSMEIIVHSSDDDRDGSEDESEGLSNGKKVND